MGVFQAEIIYGEIVARGIFRAETNGHLVADQDEIEGVVLTCADRLVKSVGKNPCALLHLVGRVFLDVLGGNRQTVTATRHVGDGLTDEGIANCAAASSPFLHINIAMLERKCRVALCGHVFLGPSCEITSLETRVFDEVFHVQRILFRGIGAKEQVYGVLQ